MAAWSQLLASLLLWLCTASWALEEPASGSGLTERAQVDQLNAKAKEAWGRSAQQSMDWAAQALDLAQRSEYRLGQAQALRNLGIAHWYQEDYDDALHRVQQAQRIYQQLGDQAGVAACLSTIGTIYLNLERLELARQAYEQALKLAESIADRNRIGIVLSNLGTTLLGLNDPQQALVYFDRALGLLEEDGSELDVLTALANIGGAQRRLGQLEEALATNVRILKLASAIDSKVRLADALTDTAQILVALKRPAEAEEYYRRALDLTDREELSRQGRDAAQYYSELLEARGDYQNALRYYQRYSDLRDQVFSDANAEAIAEMRLRFDSERQEAELAAKRLEVQAQRSARNFFIVLSLLVLILALANYARFRAKRRESMLQTKLAQTDSLTGLFNRRALRATLPAAAELVNDGLGYALLLADIDHFKQFNDRYGHEIGDRVLIAVAQALSAAVRTQDRVGRWGGEEFLLVLPEVTSAEAEQIAERVMSQVRELQVQVGDASLSVTITLGLCLCRQAESFDQCLQRADAALYKGKTKGRNRIEQAECGLPSESDLVAA